MVKKVWWIELGRRKKYETYMTYYPSTGKWEEVKRLKAEPTKTKRKFSSKRNESTKLRELVLKHDKHKCVECGCKQRLQVHHEIPLSKGGNNELSNLLTLCDICHMEKHRSDTVYRIMLKSFFIYQTIAE